jgi:dipeptidyl aminopeptidase/acylaminoacyl peptidase
VFSKTQVSNPSELYLADANLKKERKVSNFNDWVLTKKLSIPTKTFTNELGMTVDIGSLQPSNFKTGKISFEIHGPSAMWGPGEAVCGTNTNIFVVSYGVVQQSRGSGGYSWIF